MFHGNHAMALDMLRHIMPRRMTCCAMACSMASILWPLTCYAVLYHIMFQHTMLCVVLPCHIREPVSGITFLTFIGRVRPPIRCPPHQMPSNTWGCTPIRSRPTQGNLCENHTLSCCLFCTPWCRKGYSRASKNILIQ